MLIYEIYLAEKLTKTFKDLIDQAVEEGLDYKILLLFLFYKALSDKWLKAVEDYRKEGYSNARAYLLANQDYVLFDEENNKLLTWHEAMKSKETIMELANTLTRIARLNEKLSDLQILVEQLGLRNLQTSDKLRAVNKILDKFNEFNFSTVPYNVIGDVYIWMLNYSFLEGKEPDQIEKGKEGESYTPKEVARLLVQLLEIENGSTILNPALGSGIFLIESYNCVRDRDEPELMLYGQVWDDFKVPIVKMNLILHGIKDYEIFVGDSLSNPRFGECDYVLANPQWRQKYEVRKLREPKVKKIYTTFARDGFPPSSSMDWAWIQLMLYFAKKKVGIILDNGALFRGRKERKIREEIVRKDLLEAVILLPKKLFYNSNAPAGCIMVFNKNKEEERKGKIIFINASNEYEKHPEVKRLNKLGEENIRKIVEAYKEFKSIEGFSKVVDIKEVEKNDFNLNVTLYVVPLEEEEEIDLSMELEEFRKIEEEEYEIIAKAKDYIKKILTAKN